MKGDRYYFIWEFQISAFTKLSEHRTNAERFETLEGAMRRYNDFILKWKDEVRNKIHSDYFPYHIMNVGIVKAKGVDDARTLFHVYRTKYGKIEIKGNVLKYRHLTPYRIKGVKSDRFKAKYVEKRLKYPKIHYGRK